MTKRRYDRYSGTGPGLALFLMLLLAVLFVLPALLSAPARAGSVTLQPDHGPGGHGGHGHRGRLA